MLFHDRLGIMCLGKIVEMGSKKGVFSNPKHPYTQALLDSIPKISGAPAASPAGPSSLSGVVLTLPPGPGRLDSRRRTPEEGSIP